MTPIQRLKNTALMNRIFFRRMLTIQWSDPARILEWHVTGLWGRSCLTIIIIAYSCLLVVQFHHWSFEILSALWLCIMALPKITSWFWCLHYLWNCTTDRSPSRAQEFNNFLKKWSNAEFTKHIVPSLHHLVKLTHLAKNSAKSMWSLPFAISQSGVWSESHDDTWCFWRKKWRFFG